MTSSSEELRRRIEDLEVKLDSLDSISPSAPRPIVVKTITVGTYPTVAKAMYAVVALSITCDETEGATPSLSAASSPDKFYALNVGSQIPVSGTEGIVCEQIDGLWQFEFDGN